MSNKTEIEILSQLASVGKSQFNDEFAGAPHFAVLEANNDAVAEAVKRQLKERGQAAAEEAASTIITQLEQAEKAIEKYRSELGQIRMEEQIKLNHIHTIAVARVFATKTNNYVPLYHALRKEWDSVDIPEEDRKAILKEIKQARHTAPAAAKKAAPKAAEPQAPGTTLNLTSRITGKNVRIRRNERQTGT